MANKYTNCESVCQFAKELCKEKETGAYAKGYNNALHAIMSAARSEALPAADVRPVVRGRWKQVKPQIAICSACGQPWATNGRDMTGNANIFNALYHFCPNCGADMRKVQNDN